MITNLDHFNQWVKQSTNTVSPIAGKRAVVYTRVSSKEQYDKNLSLDWQRKAIDDFAVRNNFEVLDYYGGTFESAKTDGRKEFLRMLEFIRCRFLPC